MTGNLPDKETKKPLVISVASGKGGVGKTRISLGVACEFARGFKTLVVDLDFFNRGLTGMLPKGKPVRFVKGPSFVQGDAGENHWQLMSADTGDLKNENFFYLKYPDLTEEQTMAFVATPIPELRQSLETMFADIVSKVAIDVIVLDCHGGPDNTSFAANAVADFSLLVTDSDKASLHGTFNFIRQLEYAEGHPPKRTHIVFNRIPARSSFNLLEKLHDEYFMPKLGGSARLLAVFPTDERMREASDKVSLFPLLIPNSLWVRKVRTMIFDMLAGSKHRGKLDALNIRYIPIVTEFRRRAMNNIPWFLQPERVLKSVSAFAILAMFAALILIALNNETIDLRGTPILYEISQWLLDNEVAEYLSSIGAVGSIVAGGWLISASWISGTINVKEKVTAAMLRGKKGIALYNLLKILAIWFIPALMTAGFIAEWQREFDDLFFALFLAIVALSYAGYLLKALYETARAFIERLPLATKALTMVVVSFYVAFPYLLMGAV